MDKERLKDSVGPGRRFPFGLPRTDNANYLWIQIFYSALNETGRAGFVMANSASDARSSEQELRQKLIESYAVDVMVAVGPNMFYTVTLPCTLWFLDKGQSTSPRADTVLLVAARHIYRQVDRATANGRLRRLASSPTSSDSIAARHSTSPSAATKRARRLKRCSPKPLEKLSTLNLQASTTRTFPACVARPRSRKFKRKAGRSTPDVTSAWPPAKP